MDNCESRFRMNRCELPKGHLGFHQKVGEETLSHRGVKESKIYAVTWADSHEIRRQVAADRAGVVGGAETFLDGAVSIEPVPGTATIAFDDLPEGVTLHPTADEAFGCARGMAHGSEDRSCDL